MPSALQELLLKIGGDSEGGQQAVRDLSNVLANTLAKSLKQTGDQAETSTKQISGFTRYLDNLTPSTKNAGAAFKDLHSTLTGMWENPTGAVKDFAGAVGGDLAGALGTAGIAAGVFAGAVAAVGVVAVGLTEKAAATGAKLQDLSEKTGMTVQGVSRLSKAAVVAGTDIDTLSNAVFIMQKNMEESPEKFEKGLGRLGLAAAEFKRLAPEEQLQAIGAALKSTEDPVQRNAAGFELMGKQFRDLAPPLMKLNAALEMTKDLKPWDNEQAELAEKYVMHMANLRLHLEAIVNGIGKQLLPYMETLLEDLEAIGKWMPGEWFKNLYRLVTGGPLGLVQGLAGGLERQWGGAAMSLLAPNGAFAGLGGMIGTGGVGGLQLPTAPKAPYEQFALPGGDAGRIVGTTDQETFKLLEGYFDDLKKKSKEYAESLEKLRIAEGAYEGALRDLGGTVVEAIRYELEHKASVEDIARVYKVDAQYVDLIKEKMHDEAEAAKNLAEAEKKLFLEGAKHTQEWAKQVAKSLDETNQKVVRFFELWQQAQRQHDDAIAKDTLSASDYQRYVLNQQLQDAERNLEQYGEAYRKTYDEIVATVQIKLSEIDTAWHEHPMLPPDAASKARELEAAIQSVGGCFETLGSQASGSLGATIGLIGQTILLMQQWQALMQKTGPMPGLPGMSGIPGLGGFNKVLSDPRTQAYMQAYGPSIMSGLSAVTGGTDERGRPTSFAQTMNSAMNWKSASTYTSALATGGISLGVQAIIGTIKFLFRDRTMEDVARDAGEKFGTTFSKATMDKIQKAHEAGLNEFAAEMTNFSDIIKDAGGLTDKNIGQMTARLHDVFSGLTLGWLQTADAQKILNENFDQFVAASTDGYGRISDELKGIIDLDRQFGTNSEAVARFMQQQASDVAAGLSDLLEQPMLTADAAVGQALDDAQKKLDDLKASGTASAKQLQDAQDAVTKALTDQHAAAERDRQAINDLGEEALLSFNASIAAGDSFTTALQKIAPQLTTVQQAFKDLGIDVDNAAVKGLLLQNTILNGPDGKGGVGRAITGLQTMFTAATNMPGVMTPEAFAAQQRTLGSIYTQTQGAAAAAGGTTIDALAPFQQTLHEMADWAAKNHVELDDNTKQMIDQSRELGIWNADFKTDSEKTRDSIANLITSNDALAAALGGLPDALAAVMAGRTPPPPPTTPTYAALGGVVTRFGLARPRYFDSGGFVAPWAAGGPLWTDPGVVSSSKLVAMIPKGSDIVPAMLRVGETVLTPDEGDLMSRLMAQARLGTIGGEMGGWDAKTTALIAARAAAQAAGTGGPDTVNKVYNVTITAKNDEAAEKWRDWMRADGVAIAVEEFEDGRFVSRMNRALDR